MNPRVKAFAPLEHIGTLTVIDCKSLGRLTKENRYIVHFDCCGATGSLLHEQIRRRAHDGTTLCNACATKASRAKCAVTIRERVAKPSRKGPAFADEIPIVERRAGVPTAAYLLAIHDRAMAIVSARHGATA